MIGIKINSVINLILTIVIFNRLGCLLSNWKYERISRRSDIDSRLIELQAKIDIVFALKQMQIGHGQFDFEKM